MTPKQQVLQLFRNACIAKRTSNGEYVVMQSVISWGPPVGGDGKTPREAWAKAAENLPNWRAHFSTREVARRSSNNRVDRTAKTP